MKTNTFSRLVVAALGAAALPFITPAKGEQPEATQAASGGFTLDRLSTENGEDNAVQWEYLERIEFDSRREFLKNLKLLETKVDAQVHELNAKRSAMNSTIDTRDWDLAMKEMLASQVYLNGMNEEVDKATPDTWDQVKDKVHQAWTRTQNAYDKVKSSTTS